MGLAKGSKRRARTHGAFEESLTQDPEQSYANHLRDGIKAELITLAGRNVVDNWLKTLVVDQSPVTTYLASSVIGSGKLYGGMGISLSLCALLAGLCLHMLFLPVIVTTRWLLFKCFVTV